MQYDIPVFFAANNDYVPYLGVALSSMIYCANAQNAYSVFILHIDITAENQKRLENLSTPSVTVRCRNVSPEMKDINIISTNHLTPEATFRLLIPELFPEYKKVLYLDCDLVVLRDVAHLYDFDVDEKVLGAAQEFLSESTLNYLEGSEMDFPPDDYINSGVLVINTERFKDRKIKEKSFQLLNGTKTYAYLDQDALNITCHGDIAYLDRRWNCCWYKFCFSKPNELYAESVRHFATDPWIVHFAHSNKPWKAPGAKYAGYFWKYAKNTPFYEEILDKNSGSSSNSKNYLIPYEIAPIGSSVAVYGAGQLGKALCHQIEFNGFYSLKIWVDRNYTELQETGNDVNSPESLIGADFDYVIIAIEKQDIAEDVTSFLKSIGVEHQKILWIGQRTEIK